jgi:hypothetical protein
MVRERCHPAGMTRAELFVEGAWCGGVPHVVVLRVSLMDSGSVADFDLGFCAKRIRT